MYADVLVEIKTKKLDKTFTYKIPEDLQNEVRVGVLVEVPFGKKTVEGYVLGVHSNDVEYETKEIKKVKLEELVLNSEMIQLGKILQEQSLASLSSCYAAMLPKALKAKKGIEVHKKYVSYLQLNLNEVDGKRTKEQECVLSLFSDHELVLKKDAQEISKSAVQTLLKKNVLVEVKQEEARYQLQEEEIEEKKELTEEQQKALSKIGSFLNQAKTILLHGVTGSGKTEVYMQVIEQVLKEGKTALVLVPEISLTPQFINRFNKRFYKEIAVLHSHLSDGERYDEWRKILKKEVHIVIGARSAIFAPLENLGIIILDEEHSDSYKQENTPKYHALQMALERSKTWNCPVLLGSATPSLNAMARALKKVYEYVPMTKRALGMQLPHITLVDMAEEVKHRHPILSRELEYQIIERLNKQEQVVLLLNRRGHSTTISCSNCGFTYRCPHCDITLTYHKTSKHLRCHYCGYTKFLDEACPNCQEKGLTYYGLGTEKLEEYLNDVFPTARILRMDADSTQNKGMYEQITNDFYEHKYDLLVGTQMVSKGLDFPNVTLVGILQADASLNIPDYKSNERSFSLLTQASGRAGRRTTLGEVIIQTYNPNHPILKCVQAQDYKNYFTYEMRIRKTLNYPPFYYLAQVKLKGREYTKVSAEIKKAKYFLEHHIDSDSILLGPATSSPFLVNNIYSFELLIKYRKDSLLKKALGELEQLYLNDKDLTLDIDLFY